MCLKSAVADFPPCGCAALKLIADFVYPIKVNRENLPRTHNIDRHAADLKAERSISHCMHTQHVEGEVLKSINRFAATVICICNCMRLCCRKSEARLPHVDIPQQDKIAAGV